MGTTDPLAEVHRYIHAFNDGDEAGMAAVFDTDGIILDGMAPHVWTGPSAAQDWYRDVLIEAGHHRASGYTVTLAEPLHCDITGDTAYLVVPATMTFDLSGTTVTQTGAFFTVALRSHAERWRIAAWAWTKGKQV